MSGCHRGVIARTVSPRRGSLPTELPPRGRERAPEQALCPLLVDEHEPHVGLEHPLVRLLEHDLDRDDARPRPADAPAPLHRDADAHGLPELRRERRREAELPQEADQRPRAYLVRQRHHEPAVHEPRRALVRGGRRELRRHEGALRREAEAEPLLKHALAVLESADRKPNPRVALALGGLGAVAKDLGNLDEAEADFKREAEIYRSVYGDQHQNTAIALSNLASVYREKKQYTRAEGMFRDVIQRLTRAVPADDLNLGIARIRLGDVLCAEERYQDAESELVAGYGIVAKQSSPQVTYLKAARKDLVEVYAALKQPEKAAKFRAELAAQR